MSLEPIPFTYSYSQPAEYHFCQDSVLFPRWVASQLRDIEISSEFRALDVCAGCGVLGLELAFHEKRLKRFDFMEIQPEFREHFALNLAMTGHDPEGFCFLPENYAALRNESFAGRYELIIGNPPYFLPNEGRLSPSELRNRCRFFIDSDLVTLFQGVILSLKPGGRAFLLMKSGTHHGRFTLGQLELKFMDQAELRRSGEIRGTEIIEVIRIQPS